MVDGPFQQPEERAVSVTAGSVPGGRGDGGSTGAQVVGWGVFLGILAHKAECAGRELIPVNPTNTSRTCPECGHVDGRNRDRERFRCTACGHTGHADHIAALNIATRAGLALRTVA